MASKHLTFIPTVLSSFAITATRCETLKSNVKLRKRSTSLAHTVLVLLRFVVQYSCRLEVSLDEFLNKSWRTVNTCQDLKG